MLAQGFAKHLASRFGNHTCNFTCETCLFLLRDNRSKEQQGTINVSCKKRDLNRKKKMQFQDTR